VTESAGKSEITKSDAATEPPNDDFTTPVPPRKTASSAAPMLAGMMLAVGEILEPEKTKVEIAVEHSKPVDDLPFELGFGDLPPLD
jgi:hypothetical protein